MFRFECNRVIGWWVALFLAMWAALYLFGDSAARATLPQLMGRLAGGGALLLGLLVFLLAFMSEVAACDCAHAWLHLSASLAATALIAGPVMLGAERSRPWRSG